MLAHMHARTHSVIDALIGRMETTVHGLQDHAVVTPLYLALWWWTGTLPLDTPFWPQTTRPGGEGGPGGPSQNTDLASDGPGFQNCDHQQVLPTLGFSV